MRPLSAPERPEKGRRPAEEEELNKYNCIQSSRRAIVSRKKTDPARCKSAASCTCV